MELHMTITQFACIFLFDQEYAHLNWQEDKYKTLASQIIWHGDSYLQHRKEGKGFLLYIWKA